MLKALHGLEQKELTMESVESFIVKTFKLRRYTVNSIARVATLKFGKSIRSDNIPKILSKAGIEGYTANERACIFLVEKKRPNFAKPDYYGTLMREIDKCLSSLIS